MSKEKKKTIILEPINEYVDKAAIETEQLKEIELTLKTIDTMLLLLKSNEDEVLLRILEHITNFLRKSDNNFQLLKEKNMINLLMEQEFFYHSFAENLIIKRFALYIFAELLDHSNILKEFNAAEILQVVQICTDFFVKESDDFCLEYFAVALDKSLENPTVIEECLIEVDFKEKLFEVISNTTNPDTLCRCLGILQKLIKFQTTKQNLSLIFQSSSVFPFKRLLCELSSNFIELKEAALHVLHLIVADFSNDNPLTIMENSREKEFVLKLLQELTELFCNTPKADEDKEQNLWVTVISVLAATLQREPLAQLWFEYNLFDRYLNHLDTLESKPKCQALLVISEVAKYKKWQARLDRTIVTDMLLACILAEGVNDMKACDSAMHILIALNRLITMPQALSAILDSFEQGLIKKLLVTLSLTDIDLKLREQVALFLCNLLEHAFRKTCTELFEPERAGNINAVQIFANILRPQEGQISNSIDLQIYLLNCLETIASYSVDYRELLGADMDLSKNLAELLVESFSSTILANNIIRLLSILVQEENTQTNLLSPNVYFINSLKRALKSLSNMLKTAGSNFVIQTTQYAELQKAYIEQGILEILIFNQINAVCVPTWSRAIDKILAKNSTLKFCIRNYLDFSDLTQNDSDFHVSKRRFDDFRIFLNILQDDCSPRDPVIVANFQRPEPSEELVVRVPVECLTPEECRKSLFKEWQYCRKPGDPNLPQYLEKLKSKLEHLGFVQSACARQKATIDFTNMAKKAAIIAEYVAEILAGRELKKLDLNTTEACSQDRIKCHIYDLAKELHCTFIPLGSLRLGCEFERAILFKCLCDQIGLPCTLQRAITGGILYNELALPPMDIGDHGDSPCDKRTMEFVSWGLLKPTHLVDLMYNVGEVYPLQSRQALQYLKLF